MGKILLVLAGIAVVVFLMFSGTYNALVGLDEAVKQAWAQVENVYQRRLDLIPNLVETVKGYAAHESKTFQAITEARSRVGGTISSDVFTDPAKFQKFQEAQSQMTGALSRLLAVAEQYPDLKANTSFLELQAQLEGTENRISVERGRFNAAAQAFNAKLRTFPTNILGRVFGFQLKEYFKADATASVAPKVTF